ncbi:unnamed protein product [Didymodactylos carnosus]|uniref:Flavin-containing monooxygenase n=1 Tax=Didymodactylos carnosus TaxID=1234261 RepID=A0A816A617_9BILA|nr:unnamed protein product [Didymodactylos carnosus]CAF1593732.1 unnamed protein product [Didymodactylos carnosus]CAF4319591.1 unnamed protein product [Didymodactylos carnosus]CAF4467125.1 unnamed protein product [Didymodactylos carnosus]
MLITDDWYPAIQKSNVHLITDNIKKINEHGVVTCNDKEYEVDTIVWSTGYNVHNCLIEFYGQKGIKLQDQWSLSTQAYRGVTVPNFPNFFILLGPNSALGHNSVLIMIESQFDYIIDCLKYMKKNQYEVLVVNANVCNQYNKEIQKKLKHTVWQEGGCCSWYQDKLGNNTTLWPGFTWTYCLLMKHFDYQNYQFEKRHDDNEKNAIQ